MEDATEYTSKRIGGLLEELSLQKTDIAELKKAKGNTNAEVLDLQVRLSNVTDFVMNCLRDMGGKIEGH